LRLAALGGSEDGQWSDAIRMWVPEELDLGLNERQIEFLKGEPAILTAAHR
jgi:hypothetical protein